MIPAQKLHAAHKIYRLAKMNPLADLAWEFHNSGYSSTDISKLMKKLLTLPDPFKTSVVNAMRDIENSRRVLTTVNLPAIKE